MLGIITGVGKLGAGVLAFVAALLVYQAAPGGPEAIVPGRESAETCHARYSDLRVLLAEEWRQDQMRRERQACPPLQRQTWDQADLQRAGLFAGGAIAAFILAAFAANAARRGELEPETLARLRRRDQAQH